MAKQKGITEEQQKDIYKRYMDKAQNYITMEDLAMEYGVTHSNISYIVKKCRKKSDVRPKLLMWAEYYPELCRWMTEHDVGEKWLCRTIKKSSSVVAKKIVGCDSYFAEEEKEKIAQAAGESVEKLFRRPERARK